MSRNFGPNYFGDMPPEYDAYNTTYQGKKEIIGQKFWDTKTYVSGTTTALNGFFTTTNTTIDVTNMQAAGQIPSPSAFVVRAIRFFLKQRGNAVSPTVTGNQTSAVDNVAQLINTGTITFTIGNKIYNQEPLWCVTAGAGAFGVMAATGNFAGGSLYSYAQNGIPDPRAVNTLTKPLFIQPMINFNLGIVWPAALTLTGNVDICMLLDGDLIRPIQ